MIQALTCPSCQHASTVAGDVSLQAVLRCRHCGNQVVLGETVDHELASWEVIDDPGALVVAAMPGVGEASVAGEAVQETEVAEHLPELELVVNEIPQDELQQVPPTPEVPATPSKQKFDWSKYDTSGYEPLRAKKKPRSPIWSILSVASGGLAAIPIATLLIWHLLGKDPLELGPTVARYIPWIVPSRFHPYENPDQFQQSARTITASSPERGSSGFRQFDEIMPAPDVFRDNPVSDSAAASELSASERPEVSSYEATEPTTAATESLQSSIVDSSASTVEIPNVFSVIKRVEADLEAWSTGQKQHETKKKLAKQLYADLTELAWRIDEQPSHNPILRLINDQLQPVGREIKEQADVQSLIQAGARYWISSHPAEGKLGLAIVGEVTEATASNGAWELVISPEIGGSQPLRVVVPGLLNSSLMAGQRLLMLGIVTREFTDPTSELPVSAPDGITFVANYLYAL